MKRLGAVLVVSLLASCSEQMEGGRIAGFDTEPQYQEARDHDAAYMGFIRVMMVIAGLVVLSGLVSGGHSGPPPPP